MALNFPPAYLEGIRLFNEGHFWHAHEQWEQCWLGAGEPEATFYKSIIQAAAALVKWQQGNLRGVHRNWAKSRLRFARLPEIMLGLNTIAFQSAMETFVAACAAGEPATPPRITLHTRPSG